MRLPTLNPPSAASLLSEDDEPPPPATFGALGFFVAATASSNIFTGSLMARFTPDSITGFPANRCRSFTPMSVAKITASAFFTMSSGSGVIEEEPWVSTCRVTPGISFAAMARASAAM
jgi:hypothetical protein